MTDDTLRLAQTPSPSGDAETKLRQELEHELDRGKRPSGSNADEWHLFLSQHLDNRAQFPYGMSYVAVQIAEALDAAALAPPSSKAAETVDVRLPFNILNLVHDGIKNEKTSPEITDGIMGLINIALSARTAKAAAPDTRLPEIPDDDSDFTPAAEEASVAVCECCNSLKMYRLYALQNGEAAWVCKECRSGKR